MLPVDEAAVNTWKGPYGPCAAGNVIEVTVACVSVPETALKLDTHALEGVKPDGKTAQKTPLCTVVYGLKLKVMLTTAPELLDVRAIGLDAQVEIGQDNTPGSVTLLEPRVSDPKAWAKRVNK